MSIQSDDTNPQSNQEPIHTSRIKFQLTITETTPETFTADLVAHINNILEVININTPGAKLAPWHKMTVEQNELVSELQDDPLMPVKYLYGFKVGMNKAGTQYFRIHIAFPSHYMDEDIIQKNKNLDMIPGKQSLLKALMSTPLFFSMINPFLFPCWPCCFTDKTFLPPLFFPLPKLADATFEDGKMWDISLDM